jgi:hypothetical protein
MIIIDAPEARCKGKRKSGCRNCGENRGKLSRRSALNRPARLIGIGFAAFLSHS